MNIVILSGRLTADPDIRMGTNDTKIARYILAVERRVKKEHGKKIRLYCLRMPWEKCRICREIS